jgi:hypothetical protein
MINGIGMSSRVRILGGVCTGLALVLAQGLAGCGDDGGQVRQDARTSWPMADAGGQQQDTSWWQQDGGGQQQDTGSQQQSKVCWYFCNTVTDCPAGAVACKDKACLECTDDSHCQNYPAQKCDKARGTCIFCTQDSHCTYQGQKIYSGKCDTTVGLCVKCSAPADCSWANSAYPICQNGRCVQCQSDASCAGATMKRCNTKTGMCSLCKTSAECCPPGQACGLTCDAATGNCICATAKQCSDAYQTTFKYQWDCKAP